MLRIANNGHADAVLALEAYAERAGAALACAYSSSAEYDAALRAQAPPQADAGDRRRRRRRPRGHYFPDRLNEILSLIHI